MGNDRMASHHSPLFIAQRPGFQQNTVWNADLPNVVEQRAPADVTQFVLPDSQRPRQPENLVGGMTAEVVTRQVLGALSRTALEDSSSLVIAYEPVWAIGTGKAATPDGANAVIDQHIRPALVKLYNDEIARDMRILYGGSVKASIAGEFFSQPDIDGALVGGASLKVDEFIAITQAAAVASR